MSTEAKILSFSATEAQLNGRIPEQLEFIESGGYIFLRESAGVEDCSLRPIGVAVQKFGRVRAW
jgi:hypothetical protein